MFTSGVSSTDDAAIDILFSGGKTPGADDLLGGKEDPKKVEKKEPEQKDPAQPETEERPEHLTATDEELTDKLFEGTPTEEDGTPKKKEEPKKVEAKLPENQEVNYQAIYNDMVAQGVWEEVEIPEGTEFTKELFVDIQKLQAKSKYEDFLSNTGPYGKAIIEFEQNGGNPGELLGLFREQKEVQDFDISEADGQEAFLRSYLEAQGSSEKSIERQILSFKNQGGLALKEEAEEKKAIWDAQYSEEIEDRKKEQVLYSKQLEEAQRNFQKNITTTLTSDSELSPKERKELQNYMLNYSKTFQGKQVSQFYEDMAVIQQNPKDYIELAKFIKGLRNGEYTKKVVEKVKKEATAQSYLKIKNGAALKIPGGGNPELESTRGSNFLSFLNKK